MITTRATILAWGLDHRRQLVLKFRLERVDDTDGEVVASEPRSREIPLGNLPAGLQTDCAAVEARLLQLLRTQLANAKDPNPTVTVA